MATDYSQSDQTQSFINLIKGTGVSHCKIIVKLVQVGWL